MAYRYLVDETKMDMETIKNIISYNAINIKRINWHHKKTIEALHNYHTSFVCRDCGHCSASNRKSTYMMTDIKLKCSIVVCQECTRDRLFNRPTNEHKLGTTQGDQKHQKIKVQMEILKNIGFPSCYIEYGGPNDKWERRTRTAFSDRVHDVHWKASNRSPRITYVYL